MTKRIAMLLILVFSLLTLVSCGHRHNWKDATCRTPKTCSDCGEIEGEKLIHTPNADGLCKHCGKDCTGVLLDGERHGIPIVAYGGVRLGMLIRTPLGVPYSYSIFDETGKLVTEGVWSKEDLTFPIAATDEYYAYTPVLSLPTGSYKVTYLYARPYRAEENISKGEIYFTWAEEYPLLSSQYPMPIIVK